MARPMRRPEEAAIEQQADYAYQAYLVLLFGFVVAPIVAGLDKFFHILAEWTQYLAPIVPSWTGIAAHTFMMLVGGVEILAGLIVALKPSFGGWLVALWLWGIIINLLLIPAYYDIALRDFGLSLGAIALTRLSLSFRD